MGKNTRKASESEQYVPPSNNSIYRPFGGWPGFMHSYGLKPSDPDDVEEGKRIVEGLKAIDKQDWEEKQAEKANKK
jgi:hypothetical protein